MKSYHGILCNKEDADLLIEAAKKGQIPLIKERFSEFERKMYIKSGSIFLFCESQSNIKRWTDGKKWSASRVNGDFLSYKELTKDFDIMSGGLTKLSYSNFKDGEKYHVVCYFNDSECNLQRPINDCVLCQRKFEQLKNEIKREREEEEISSNEKNAYTYKRHKSITGNTLLKSNISDIGKTECDPKANTRTNTGAVTTTRLPSFKDVFLNIKQEQGVVPVKDSLIPRIPKLIDNKYLNRV